MSPLMGSMYLFFKNYTIFSGFPGHPSDSLQGYVLAGPVWIVSPDLR